jgi:EAL domain-containing protein (putative c-di-GMP-specific phosphodiesterase class I)/GGDEF domain-containing protein
MTAKRAEPGPDLRSERDRFVAFSFAAADLLLEVDAEGTIRFASGAARALTGRDLGSLLGQPYIELFAPQDRRYVNLLISRLSAGHRLDPVTVKLAPAGGGEAAAIVGGCRLPHRQGQLYLTLSTPHYSAVSDGLTTIRDAASGLLDRESFETVAGAVVQRQHAIDQDVKLTLLSMAGLDDLRARAGEDAVETFLGEIGAFLRASSIGGDAAGRIAPDKFGIVHPASLDGRGIAAELQRQSREIDPEGAGIPVDHYSVDVAIDNMTEEDAAKAIVYTIAKFADMRDSEFAVESLQSAFRSLLRDTVARIGTLKGTVSERRFDIAFQPIVDLATRAVHHHELLARLDGGRSPYALVTFAEGVGMIEEFDLAICQRAIEFLTDKAGANATIAVNLSGRSLESDLFPEALGALLKPHAALRPRLLFEITESTQIAKLEHVNQVVQTLRERGHRFALDDFGAGASSFPYLHALTVDFVKIDGAYVKRVLSNPRDAAIPRAMVVLCRDLGVRTIAEMVESEEQARELKALGVDFGQGYLFGKPAPQPVVPERGADIAAGRNVARPMLRQGTGRSWT